MLVLPKAGIYDFSAAVSNLHRLIFCGQPFGFKPLRADFFDCQLYNRFSFNPFQKIGLLHFSLTSESVLP